MADRLTPAELMDLKSDPRMKDPAIQQQVFAKLAPEDVQALSGAKAPSALPSGGGMAGAAADTLGQTSGDLALGAAKGAGSTVSGLGKLVSMIPGLGSATNALGNAVGGQVGKALYGQKAEPVSNDAAFAQSKQDLTASNPTQSLGKGAEQLGEFLLPGAKMGAGPTAAHAASDAAAELMWKVPPSVWDALGPQATHYINKLISEGGMATGISAAHGDSHPVLAGATAGLMAPAAGGVAAAVPAAAEVAPYLAGGAAGHAAFGGGGGLAGGLGIAAMGRNVVRKHVTTPENVQLVQGVIRRLAPLLGRMGAGAVGQGTND